MYRAVLRGTTSCAVKVFKFNSHPHAYKHFLHEVEILRSLDHPHIIGALGASVRGAEGIMHVVLTSGGTVMHPYIALLPLVLGDAM